MALNLKSNTVSLRCINIEVIESALEGWSGTIVEDMLAGAAWASDSRQILTFSDFQIRATVWSLVEQTQTAFIKGPKLLPPHGLDFSSNGKFMCLAERRESKDWIAIYYAGHDWKLSNCFEASSSYDLVDCKWAEPNTSIIVQDSPLEPRFVVYSAVTGAPIAIH